jgi:hypothetical protein
VGQTSTIPALVMVKPAAASRSLFFTFISGALGRLGQGALHDGHARGLAITGQCASTVLEGKRTSAISQGAGGRLGPCVPGKSRKASASCRTGPCKVWLHHGIATPPATASALSAKLESQRLCSGAGARGKWFKIDIIE